MPQSQEPDERRRKRDEAHGQRTVEKFRASSRGLRRIFEKHFPDKNGEVDALVIHLARLEANLPNIEEAIRLARYPGAGDRDPKRMALGLWENLSLVRNHLEGALSSLEQITDTDLADRESDLAD